MLASAEVSSAYPEQSTWLGGSEEFSHTNYPVQVDGDGSYTVSAGNPSLMDGDPSKMLHGDQVSYHHQGIVIHLPDGHQLTSPSVSSQQTHLRSPPGEPMRNALFGTLEVQAKSVDLYGAPALLFVFGVRLFFFTNRGKRSIGIRILLVRVLVSHTNSFRL